MAKTAPGTRPQAITIPLSDEDHELMQKLKKITGIQRHPDLVRSALRAYDRELARIAGSAPPVTGT